MIAELEYNLIELVEQNPQMVLGFQTRYQPFADFVSLIS